MLLDATTLLLVTTILTSMVGSLFLLSWSQTRHVHALAIWGARLDPQFMAVFARHIKHRALLDV